MRELNLIPYHIREQKAKKLQIRNNIALAVIIFCILFVSVYIPNLSLNKLKSSEAKFMSQVSSDKKVLDENIKINSEISNINMYTDKIAFMTKNKILVSKRMASLQKYIPKDIILTTLSYTKTNVSLTGSAEKYNSIAEFAANLQASKEFKSVELTSINSGTNSQTPSGKYNFSISIVY